MDIITAEKLKFEMRIARGILLNRIKKKHGFTIDDIIYDLEHSGDRGIAKIWEVIKNNANKCDMGHQRKETKLWSAIFLWILSKDTAYRDLFFTTTKEILDIKDDIYEGIAKLAKESEHWYPNAHLASMKRSKRKQAKGEILEQGRAYDETILVPSKQKPRITPKGRDVEPVKIYK